MTDAPRKELPIHTGQLPLIAVSLHLQSYRDVTRLLTAIRSEAAARGWDLLNLSFTDYVLPRDGKVSGAIIDHLPDSDLAKEFRKQLCPAVRVGALIHPEDDLLPTVLPDLEAVGRLAAEHFRQHRFQHVGFVGRTNWHMSETLYESFESRAKELGCDCLLLRYDAESRPKKSISERYAERVARLAAWLGSVPKPVGLLAYSDKWGGQLSAMCQSAQLEVPGDVAILGVGNAVLDCDMSPVSLSSIDISEEERARQACSLLESLMRGEKNNESVIMVPPSGIITRASTDVLAVENPLVAEAIRYIWDNLERNMSVDHIAEAVECPRHKLERAFRKHLKRGVNAELRRRRINELARLLRETDLPIVDLAPLVGFRTMKHLHRSFRQTHGISPKKYRKQHKLHNSQ